MERVKEEEGGGEERKEISPPPPYFIFGSLPIFRAGKTPKIPFFAPKPHGNAG